MKDASEWPPDKRTEIRDSYLAICLLGALHKRREQLTEEEAAKNEKVIEWIRGVMTPEIFMVCEHLDEEEFKTMEE